MQLILRPAKKLQSRGLIGFSYFSQLYSFFSEKVVIDLNLRRLITTAALPTELHLHSIIISYLLKLYRFLLKPNQKVVLPVNPIPNLIRWIVVLLSRRQTASLAFLLNHRLSLPNNPYAWVVFVEPTVTFIVNPTYPDSVSKSVKLCDDANILVLSLCHITKSPTFTD